MSEHHSEDGQVDTDRNDGGGATIALRNMVYDTAQFKRDKLNEPDAKP